MPLLFEMREITRRFPGGVVANQDVTLEIERGEVHALLGENGAGKSTLMKIAFGMQAPSEGRLRWKGKDVSFPSSAEAMACGIGMVHQHFMLIPRFKVWENIVLGHEPQRGGRLDADAARQRIGELAHKYGLEVDPDQEVRHLSVGQQQRVEILKALYRDLELLILDEPTAVLTPQEADELFETLRQLVSEGLTVIFISHKLREVRAIADRFTILRKGRKVAEGRIDAYNDQEIATAMVGRPPSTPSREPANPSPKPWLSIEALSLTDHRGQTAVHDLSLHVHRGEIVGVAGVEGNGQHELQEAIIGLRRWQQGDIQLGEQSLQALTVRQRYEAGMAHVPENRQTRGLVMQDTNAQNLLLGRQHEAQYHKRPGWLHHAHITDQAKERLVTFEVSPPDPQRRVSSLSGGNQQKVVIAREFTRDAHFFLIAHPTRGVDIGAIEAIHQAILALRAEDAALLLFSAELPELLALCDRIVVMYEGRIVGECTREEATETKLGLMMTGASMTVAQS